MQPVNCFRLFRAVFCKYHIKRRENHAHYLFTNKGRIIVPKSFFTELDRMNKILEEAGSEKQWTPEEYVKEQFGKAIKESILRPDDKVKK